MAVKRLKEFLDGKGIKYMAVSHSPAYTAQEVAASACVPGKELAKTVIVKIDGKFAMAVLPASSRVNFDTFKQSVGAARVELASEQEFKDLFPECDVGAMPPFGNLYDMNVYISKRLSEDKEIAFNAGSHTELLRMSFEDFERLVKPKTIEM